MAISKKEAARMAELSRKARTGKIEAEEMTELENLEAKAENVKTLTFPERFGFAFASAGKASPNGWEPPSSFPYNPALGSKSTSEWDKSVETCSKAYAQVVSGFLTALKRDGLEITPVKKAGK